MPTIVPGYDFGVHETPTRELLLRQARFLQVSGIGIDSIAATLIGMRNGASGSSAASLPAQGWLWSDPEGSMWVKTLHGEVRLKRAGGGYETRRYGRGVAAVTTSVQAGYPIEMDTTDATSQQTEGCSYLLGASDCIATFRAFFDDSDNGASHRNTWISAETITSSVSFPRVVGRGMALFVSSGTLSFQAHLITRPSVMRIDSSPAWFQSYADPSSNNIPSAAQNKEQWYGTSIAPSSGSSVVNDGGIIEVADHLWGWKYDQCCAGAGIQL